MNIEEIQKILPHRYPFLLVDRVLSVEVFKKLVAIKNVTINEPFFAGHFPTKPVMPGVLILEALAQTCALLAYASTPTLHGKAVYLMSIDGAKFRRPVVPGDRLELTSEAIRVRGVIWKQLGTATVDGHVVAEAEFLATLAEDAPDR